MTPSRREMIAAPLILAAAPRGPGDPTAMTRHGPVRGAREGGVCVFRGVRYGDDTGPVRFQPPRAPEPWREARAAVEYGGASPQNGAEPRQSEDCLFLNVWTPGVDAGRRPVMVYIHGGGYGTGSGSDPLYDGTRLAARRDVVVVTLNHRLGPLGYAPLGRIDARFPDAGNVGQLDLVLALQWVRDSIAAFGGDPTCVTVFGQSGGGAKIATLMAMPAARGLFHRAITMSGQQVTASGPLNAETRGRAWLEAVGEDVAAAPVERLLEAGRMRDPVLGYGSLYFGPVLDGRSLGRHPFYPDAPEQSADIPMIIGNTRDETLAFLGGDPANAGLTWETLPGRLTRETLRIDVAPEAVVEAYRRMRPDWSPDQVLIGATTAGRSWRAAVIELEARAAQGTNTWAYQLDFEGELANGRRGAFHTADIALAFDNADAAGSPMRGPEAWAMADVVSGAFAHFAQHGRPGGAGVPDWPAYGLERRETMIWDLPPRVEADPRGDERRFFSAIPYVQPGT